MQYSPSQSYLLSTDILLLINNTNFIIIHIYILFKKETSLICASLIVLLFQKVSSKTFMF